MYISKQGGVGIALKEADNLSSSVNIHGARALNRPARPAVPRVMLTEREVARRVSAVRGARDRVVCKRHLPLFVVGYVSEPFACV